MAETATAPAPRSSTIHPLLEFFAASFALVLLLCLLFEPIWETNDDIAMSMVVHGYGIADSGSPKLVFSNLIWGLLLHHTPGLPGVPGYSLVTLAVLVICGAVLAYGLHRLGQGRLVAYAVLVLMLTRPVLFPQYTIIAGLLAVAAILCWHLFARQGRHSLLLAAALLAYASYLVRSQEFLLVLLVALPVLPWSALLRQRASQVAVLAVVAAVAVSAAIDYRAYRAPEWADFNNLHLVRAPYTDFGVDQRLKQRPDILARHGYSLNDIGLLRQWFFFDPEIADPEKLAAMLDELGPLPSKAETLDKTWIAIRTFGHHDLLPLLLAALLMAALRPGWRVAMTWGLCVAAAVAIGLLGRPGVMRVYVPLLCLLLIAPFLCGGPPRLRWPRLRAEAGLLLAAALLNAALAMSDSLRAATTAERIRDGLAGFPSSPVVIWGSAFPFRAAYPVLNVSSAARSYRLFGLGTLGLAPYAVGAVEQAEGRGMRELLVAEDGLPLVARRKQLQLLAGYCRERLGGELTEVSARRYGSVHLRRLRCDIKP